MNALRLVGSRAVWCGAATALALGWMPAAATADHGHVRVGVGIGVGPARPGIWVPPVYENRARTVTIPPVYEEQVRRVWREPVYRLRRVPVETPARVIERRVPRYNRFGRVIGYETVREVVRPARTVWRAERVLVQAGHFETVVERVLVRPAATKLVYEKTLVRPGYWAQPGRNGIRKAYDPTLAFTVGFRR